MPQKSAIGRIASAKTSKAFAEELSSYSSFTSAELKELFPKKTDRNELTDLIKIVNSSANENQQKADLINNIQNVGGAVLKVVKKIIP